MSTTDTVPKYYPMSADEYIEFVKAHPGREVEVKFDKDAAPEEQWWVRKPEWYRTTSERMVEETAAAMARLPEWKRQAWDEELVTPAVFASYSVETGLQELIDASSPHPAFSNLPGLRRALGQLIKYYDAWEAEHGDAVDHQSARTLTAAVQAVELLMGEELRDTIERIAHDPDHGAPQPDNVSSTPITE